MDRIITISRQFGSGGRQIARLIGQKLGIPVFDKEIINKAAEQSGIAVEHFEKADEKRTGSFLFSLVSAHYGPVSPMEVPSVVGDDNLYIHAAKAVKKLASGPCVVVGRCGDDTLKDLCPFRVFVCAEFSVRVARVAQLHSLTDKEAASLTKKTDKARANYYNFYTGKVWGEPTNYDITINTTLMTPEKAADIIIKTLS